MADSPQPYEDPDRVTFSLRIDDQNPVHTRVSVFAGMRPGSRGRAGQLVFRNHEWEAFKELMNCEVTYLHHQKTA